MSPEHMTALVNAVVARFQDELAAGSDAELHHLANRAEGRYASDLGDRMRACVDYERTRRAFAVTAPIGGAS